MTRDEKIKNILSNYWRGKERIIVAEYLRALHRNNTELIETFEMYGNRPNQIVRNFIECSYAKANFGFKNIPLDNHGWAKFEWVELEKTQPTKDNEIRLGKGENGNWTFGLNISYGGAAGSSWWPNVFGNPFSSKNEALIAALEYLLAQFEDVLKTDWKRRDTTNYKIAFCKKAVAEIQRKIEEVKGVNIQLSLF